MQLEKLESRRLLSAAVVSAVPDVSGGVTSVEIASHFKDTNPYVVFDFGGGNVIDIKLRTETPITTQNFLNYVNRGAYNQSIIHRSVPGFIIQGGGFSLGTNSTLQTIPTDPPILNEFSKDVPVGGKVNLRGTVSMAKLGGDPNSATDQFFVSLADNSSNLDNQNGGFTVFGDVVGGTMTTADAIAALQRTDVSATINSAFTDLPYVTNSNGDPSYVLINTATAVAQPLTFSATSDNPNVVKPTVAGGSLTLAYPGSGSGMAHITVTATSLDGSTTTDTFTVSRSDTNKPTATVSGASVAADNSSFTFMVVYHDNVAVKAATIDNSDVRVTGPQGFSQNATLVSLGLADGNNVTAIYKVTAPTGVFSTSNGGTFTFSANANQVTDNAGNALPAGSIGTLGVQFVASGSRPDLVATTVKGIKPTALVPGANNNAATVTVVNKGLTAAKGNVAINLYATQDGSLSGAILLGTVTQNLSLSRGQSKDVAFTYKTPVVGAAAGYHLLAFVDANSQIDEANENNNSFVTPGTVRIAPPTVNLKATIDKLPTSIVAGKKTSFSLTIKNNGNVEAKGSTTIKIAASMDRLADANDVVLITLPTKIDIKAGASATLTVSFTPNKSITPKGREFLGAQVIFNGSPADSNPADNIVFSTKTILFS